MARLTEQGKISSLDLFLTCFAWFNLNCAAWECFIYYAFLHNLDVAAIFMGFGSMFGIVFCMDMHFYNKNGDILEKRLSEIVA